MAMIKAELTSSFKAFIIIFLQFSTNGLINAEQSCQASSSPSSTKLSVIPTETLYNGVEMPLVAAGTCFRDCTKTETNPSSIPSNPNFFGFLTEKAYRATALALDIGYTHLDTALVYRSQKAIGTVLAHKFMTGELKSREDLFITTKLFHGSMEGLTRKGTTLPLDTMTPEEVKEQIETQFELILEELGLGYVDCMLLHWPAMMDSRDEGNPARRLAAWKVLESMYERGLARSIGVSNFNEDHLEELMKDGATVLPMVNQIEASVYKQWNRIRDYCKVKGIALMAYSPLGLGNKSLLSDPVVVGIAEQKKILPAQVALRYLIQMDYVVLPLSTSEQRLKSNLDLFSFELSEDEMNALTALNSKDEGIGLPSPYDMR